MSGAVRITWLDLSAADLRRLAKKEKNPLIVRRMLAIALVVEGSDRASAAQACGMDRQTSRDWVHRYYAEGVADRSRPKISWLAARRSLAPFCDCIGTKCDRAN